MRSYLSGPSAGPLHTVVWSSRSRRRHVKGAGWLWLLIAAAGGLTWAWAAAPWIGILATTGAAAITALAVYGLVAARREMRRRAAAR